MDPREDSVVMRLQRLEVTIRRAHEGLSQNLVEGTLSFLDYQRSSADLDRDYCMRMRHILAVK